MAKFTGTDNADTITPTVVSYGVIADPEGTMPDDGDDIIEGGAGDDYIQSGGGFDFVRAGPGNDRVTGGDLDQQIFGGDGDDILDGRGGNDVIYGERGNDTITASESGEYLGGLGDDTIWSYTTSSDKELVLDGGPGTDLLVHTTSLPVALIIDLRTGVTGNPLLEFRGFENLTSGRGDDTLTGTDGANEIDGQEGDDTILGLGGDDVLKGSAGNDKLFGGDDNDRLFGGADNDLLDGGRGENELDGGAGDDRLIGNGAGDILRGGAGNDTYDVQKTNTTVTEATGEGTDLVRATATFILPEYVENLQLLGNANINGTGNGLANTIKGNDGNNALSGLGGKDTLEGKAGNDYIDGGSGADDMDGGTGDDTYVVDDIYDKVTEKAREGVDTVFAFVSYTLGDAVENLSLDGRASIDGVGNALNNRIIGNVGDNKLEGRGGDDIIRGGQGNDILDGGEDNDTLEGGADNDYIDGGSGADDMDGGTGDDTYVVDDIYDKVIERAREGVDTVFAFVGYTLGDAVENLSLDGRASIDGVGNALNNRIIGNVGDNKLEGRGGDDIIRGGQGNDILDGGEDNDTLEGGADNDYIDGGSGADDMDGGTGDDTYVVDDIYDKVTEKAREGVDTVFAFVSYTLGDAVENLSLDGRASIDGVGNALNNRIIGNVGDNKLEGLGGDDVIRGGQGNDILDGGEGKNVLDGGEGEDTVSYASYSGDVIAKFANGKVSLTGGIARTDSLYSIELVSFGSGNDTISGIDGHYVDAGDGNDTLTGFGTIRGGGGNDVIRVITKGPGNPQAFGGDGNDTIHTSGRGIYEGEDGNDTVYLAVADPSVGPGLGGHTVLGGSGIDTLRYDANRASMINNIDLATGRTHVPGESFAGFENVVSGSGNDRIAGNGAANGLWGGNGKDLLVGLGGNDRVYGGSGKDKLYGGSGKDEVTGNGGADLLVGGKGSDDFNFRKTTDSTSKSMDTIDGFGGAGRKGGDQIDVSKIDAVKGARGNQSFDFDGGKGKGHLWAEDDGRDTIIYGNIDNDRFAEIQIRIVDGRNTSADDYFANDFIL